METTTLYQINDAIGSSHKMHGKPGEIAGYGSWHKKIIEFRLIKDGNLEQIACSSQRNKIFRQIVFDWNLGSRDEQGVQKIAVCFLKMGNGVEFSLYPGEIISLLKKL